MLVYLYYSLLEFYISSKIEITQTSSIELRYICLKTKNSTLNAVSAQYQVPDNAFSLLQVYTQ